MPIQTPKTMTRDEATAAAAMLAAAGCKGRIEVEGKGFYAGQFSGYVVNVWSSNPRTGNKTLYVVREPIATEEEAKLHARTAAGKANDKDRETLARMAAERAVNQE